MCSDQLPALRWGTILKDPMQSHLTLKLERRVAPKPEFILMGRSLDFSFGNTDLVFMP